jgi:hypothetical protein
LIVVTLSILETGLIAQKELLAELSSEMCLSMMVQQAASILQRILAQIP